MSIRTVILVLWVSLGMAVAAYEAKEKPVVYENGGIFLFSVAFWPMFPANRLYHSWVGEPLDP